jgi:hypothetical protein
MAKGHVHAARAFLMTRAHPHYHFTTLRTFKVCQEIEQKTSRRRYLSQHP